MNGNLFPVINRCVDMNGIEIFIFYGILLYIVDYEYETRRFIHPCFTSTALTENTLIFL